jgi:hypothetical protein
LIEKTAPHTQNRWWVCSSLATPVVSDWGVGGGEKEREREREREEWCVCVHGCSLIQVPCLPVSGFPVLEVSSYVTLLSKVCLRNWLLLPLATHRFLYNSIHSFGDVLISLFVVLLKRNDGLNHHVCFSVTGQQWQKYLLLVYVFFFLNPPFCFLNFLLFLYLFICVYKTLFFKAIVHVHYKYFQNIGKLKEKKEIFVIRLFYTVNVLVYFGYVFGLWLKKFGKLEETFYWNFILLYCFILTLFYEPFFMITYLQKI